MFDGGGRLLSGNELGSAGKTDAPSGQGKTRHMRKNRYQIQLEKIEEDGSRGASASFEFENHDDLFRIMDFMKSCGHFRDERDAVQFALGLKLLGDAMMRNRGELFRDFEPAFVSLMKKLKGRRNPER